MSTFLFAWELGGGLGHLTVLEPPARELVRRGHRVVAALRDLSRAEEVFAGSGVAYLQAPLRTRRIAEPFPSPVTFAHILHNVGLGNRAEMRALVGAWRTIYETLRPDVVLFDHSPTALVAARGEEFRQVVTGMGFCCPPDVAPLPDWRPWLQSPAADLARDEETLRVAIDGLLAERGQPALARLADLYAKPAETLLTTLAELDHFGERPGVRYWGCWPGGRGVPPAWPRGAGSKVFAYLKPFTALPELLRTLAAGRLPTLVHCDGVNPRLARQLETETLRFTADPVDLDRAARECDLAILNATHGATAAMLVAGKPILAIPLYLEQHLIAERLVGLGTAIAAGEQASAALVAALRQILDDPSYARSARAVAARYANDDAKVRLAAYVDQLESLAQGGEMA